MKMTMQTENGSKNVCEGFEEFIKYCRVKNLSSKTISYYKECFRKFTEFFSEEKMLDEITEETIRDYILHLKANTEANNTSINTRLRGLRVMLNYFMKQGYMGSFKINLLKTNKKIKETYTNQELKILLEKPDLKECNFAEYRSWVIVNYLLATGNRLNTIINVKIEDLDLEEGYVKLRRTKNNHEQIIPISRELSKVLLEYLEYRKGDPEDYLFCNKYSKKLTPNAAKIAIRKYNRRRGVGKTSIHLFRHTFAKKWILAGGDIFRLQKVLGHKSLDMVREYVEMFGQDLKKDFGKFNALDQLVEQKEHINME